MGRSFFWPVAKSLASLGHKVTIVSDQAPGNELNYENSEVRIVYLRERHSEKRSNYYDRQLLNKIRELHTEQAFDIIHGLDSSCLPIGMNKKDLGISVAYDSECTQMSQIFSLLGMAQDSIPTLLYTSLAVAYKFMSTYLTNDRKLLKTADGVFVTTPRQQIVLERYYLYPELKTYQIPYGLEPLELRDQESLDQFKKDIGLSESAKVVVTISDMTEKYELVNVLSAFQKLAIKKPSSRLIIIGTGPYFKHVEYEMLSLALGSKVKLVGAVKDSDIPNYLGIANVFVNLSSRTTGLEPSLLAAMAQRKIVIGSEVSAISTVVEDSVDGFLIRPADYAELSNLLISIFSNQIPTREMGERARNKVVNLFDLDKMTNSTIQAYNDILVRNKKYSLNSTNSH